MTVPTSSVPLVLVGLVAGNTGVAGVTTVTVPAAISVKNLTLPASKYVFLCVLVV